MPRYALASAFSFVFIIAATATLHEVLGVSETLSPAIAMVAALVVNFVILRVWVFPGQTVHWGRQLAETVVTSAGSGLEYAIFLALHLGFDVDYLVATGRPCASRPSASSASTARSSSGASEPIRPPTRRRRPTGTVWARPESGPQRPSRLGARHSPRGGIWWSTPSSTAGRQAARERQPETA